ncbi:MAG: hypothetical protein LBK60_08910 [Verrucomicrobiales bacterium]|nr:hypothetical protein [Verrucomicrobiales bacterium]
MTEAELRKKHGVTVAWSNRNGTLQQLLYGAFYNMPTLAVLSDFAAVMGLDTVEREWREVLAEAQNDRDTLRVKPYVASALRKIRYEHDHRKVAA